MVTQRSLAQMFLALQAALAALLAIVLVAAQNPHALGAAIGTAVYAACWAAFRRGWEPARQVVVVSLTVLLIAATREPYVTQRPMLAVLVPPIAALMLTSGGWIIGSALLGVFGLSLRARFQTPLLEPLNVFLLTMCVSGLALARRGFDAAMTRAAEQANLAASALSRAQSEAIADANRATKREAELVHLQRLETVGRLAGGVAHDFNNLLTVIGGSTSMAERALACGSSPTADLEEVHLAVGRASELTKQLLAFARKQVLHKRECDLNELVSSVERLLRGVMAEGVQLCAELHPLPLKVTVDPAQLEQVLVNLVLNARDAVGTSGTIQIRTRAWTLSERPAEKEERLAGGSYACIELSDDGAGMSREAREHLFEPFFTTKTAPKAQGLGLATCFGIVRQHDGTIDVESHSGKGTLVRVLLPISTCIHPPSGADVAAEPPRVLVVEDEPQVRAIAARALGNAGFQVEQAANGALGLAAFQAQSKPFDVIVTDVVMPELSGPEMARALRKLNPHLGLVFMSGYPEAMHNAHAGEFEGAAFLAKPFAPSALVEAVRERVQRSVALRERRQYAGS